MYGLTNPNLFKLADFKYNKKIDLKQKSETSIANEFYPVIH